MIERTDPSDVSEKRRERELVRVTQKTFCCWNVGLKTLLRTDSHVFRALVDSQPLIYSKEVFFREFHEQACRAAMRLVRCAFPNEERGGANHRAGVGTDPTSLPSSLPTCQSDKLRILISQMSG